MPDKKVVDLTLVMGSLALALCIAAIVAIAAMAFAAPT
jgi:hypothetical protein